MCHCVYGMVVISSVPLRLAFFQSFPGVVRLWSFRSLRLSSCCRATMARRQSLLLRMSERAEFAERIVQGYLTQAAQYHGSTQIVMISFLLQSARCGAYNFDLWIKRKFKGCETFIIGNLLANIWQQLAANLVDPDNAAT